MEKEFIKIVKAKCKEFNVKLVLKNAKKVKISEDIFCGGYFEGISKTEGKLVCATNSPLYLNLLVHEFSHMEQWYEGAEVWKNVSTAGDVDEWLGGKNVRNINRKIDLLKMLELDCEKRAVKNIKKYNLPIDIAKYTKSANSYILFYNYLKETRKWSKPGNAPYSEKNIDLWGICPEKFMPLSYYDTIPKKIYQKFKEFEI